MPPQNQSQEGQDLPNDDDLEVFVPARTARQEHKHHLESPVQPEEMVKDRTTYPLRSPSNKITTVKTPQSAIPYVQLNKAAEANQERFKDERDGILFFSNETLDRPLIAGAYCRVRDIRKGP